MGTVATKEQRGYREVFPGLYESTEDTRDVKLTREFVAAMQKHSGSQVLGRLLEDMLREQERRQAAEA